MTPQPQHPAAVLLGPLMMVTPTERRALTPVQWVDVACALIADEDGRDDLATFIIGRIEKRLGTNPAHREALIRGDAAVLQRIRAEQERRLERERDRARRLGAPLAPVEPTEPIERLLWRASDHRMKAAELQAADDASAKADRPRINRKAIKKHLGEARRLEIEAGDMMTSEDARRWLTGSLEETKQLAQARGEEVSTEVVEVEFDELDEWGAPLRHKRGSQKGAKITRTERFVRMTIENRGGGIETAFEKGHLDGPGPKSPHLQAVGQRYREAYEIVEAQTTNAGGGGSGATGGARSPQLRVVIAGEVLAHMREDLTPRQRAVLDLVCGHDIRLRIAAAHLKAGFPATQRALRGGLIAALESLKRHREAREAGEELSAATRFRAADAEIKRVGRA